MDWAATTDAQDDKNKHGNARAGGGGANEAVRMSYFDGRRATPQDDAARMGRTSGESCESLACEKMGIGHLGSAGKLVDGDRKGLNAQQDGAHMFSSQTFA